MIGKSTLEDFPGEKIRADRPLKQVNIDSFSSSVVSIEGYFHAVVIVDCHTGYRWLYGMETRDEMLQVVKRWHGDIADLRQKTYSDCSNEKQCRRKQVERNYGIF